MVAGRVARHRLTARRIVADRFRPTPRRFAHEECVAATSSGEAVRSSTTSRPTSPNPRTSSRWSIAAATAPSRGVSDQTAVRHAPGRCHRGDASHGVRVGGHDRPQQRAPRERDRQSVGDAGEIVRQRLGRGHDEGRVGETGAGRSSGCPTHRRRVGVNTQHDACRITTRLVQHRSTVTRAEVDGHRRRGRDARSELGEAEIDDVAVAENAHLDILCKEAAPKGPPLASSCVTLSCRAPPR